MLRGQTSSTKYSPTWVKTSAKEVKEQAENWRRFNPRLCQSQQGILAKTKAPFVVDKKNVPKYVPNYRWYDLIGHAQSCNYFLYKGSDYDGGG
ncbi:hypothetical protein PoB_005388100 [Plakobranchus ocellatus]|uniref:Uncharacterized protein n=1 Tax=Plakobranchus ocellatus TaxID=259542 RepID=A0AAV4C7Q7_9GAST|nr:hypothetical protein PoB_005388100 [Plakobranchus ocellatus]